MHIREQSCKNLWQVNLEVPLKELPQRVSDLILFKPFAALCEVCSTEKMLKRGEGKLY